MLLIIESAATCSGIKRAHTLTCGNCVWTRDIDLGQMLFVCARDALQCPTGRQYRSVAGQ